MRTEGKVEEQMKRVHTWMGMTLNTSKSIKVICFYITHEHFCELVMYCMRCDVVGLALPVRAEVAAQC